MKKIVLSLLSFVTIINTLEAAPNVGQKKSTNLNKTASGCSQTTAVIDLDVNNVRARLMNGGDMWWDIPNSTASYEVPKKSGKNALFAGSIWIGGRDVGSKQLKVAAQTYRQSGNDYWSGPLDDNASITFQTCAEWDKFWKINASDVTSFRSLYAGNTSVSAITQAISEKIGEVPDIIKEWPAKGNTEAKGSGGNSLAYLPNRDMADFEDVDGIDGYNWRNGDYPKILGDQYIWWVFNDRGDSKTETGSEAIGLEIHAAAFAFATNDCLNDATFYNYRIYNFLSALDSTYMATWCDADLGNAFDDYVGCDTGRGLGILYNGDAYDDGAQGYGFNIPMVGVDYFQGPKYYDASNNLIELKMSVFTYFNNIQNVPTGNPSVLDDYYGYISGTWKDGQAFTTKCNARDAGDPTKFIFTGDPCKGGWSEASCNNPPDDRRFIHSAGPFPLVPGSEPNNITIGAVWVPNVGGGKAACFGKIQVCDDKAQDLFDAKFKLPFGPNAPQMIVTGLDKKLVFDLDNIENSNNFAEGYGTNLDPTKTKMREFSALAKKLNYSDSASLYNFEGYIVYQLKNNTVSIADIRSKDGSVNTDLARVVFQCDKKNGIKEAFNYEPNPEIDPDFYIPKLMVTGADEGIKHSFQLNQDLFASGTSKSLVNYKTYYYVAVAYAYNNFRQFEQILTDVSQKTQYLESRTDGSEQPIQVIEAMPYPANDSLYIQTYADYGTGIQLKRIEGKGNGGNELDLTEESEMEAVLGANYHSYYPTYKGNQGPMMLKVINPDSIKAGQYEVRFKVDSFYTANVDTSKGIVPNKGRWMIIKDPTSAAPDTVWSEVTLQDYSEKYLRKYNKFDWGIAGAAKQYARPGDNSKLEGIENGLINSNVLYDDITKPWLSGVRDQDGKSFLNWIRSGSEWTTNTDASVQSCSMIDFDNSNDVNGLPVYGNKDIFNTFEKVIDGTWAPYNLASNEVLSKCGYGLMFGTGSRNINRLEDVYSIDVVMTPDRKYWSVCPVVELTDNGDNGSIAEGGAFKFTMRKHAGWNGEVEDNGKPRYSSNTSDNGMSVFPGYAINLETGERLNIFFGEVSANPNDNGNDMIWNPSSTLRDPTNGDYRFGGKHAIYVTRTKYDKGEALKTRFLAAGNNGAANSQELIEAYKQVQWVGFPLLARGQEYASFKDGIIPTPTRVRIRVTRPYNNYTPEPGQTLKNGAWPLYTFNTTDLAPANIGTTRNNFSDKDKEVFKRIQPVPNPYYAVSEYERNNLDNRIRIINLPVKASLKIYTLDGVLIRTLEKNDTKTSYVDWDLKNNKNVPISSGMYLIHVILPGIGETTLKWFGAMRPTDITSF